MPRWVIGAVAVLVGCGSPGGAGLADAPLGELADVVSVHVVYGEGIPVPNIPIVFANADSSIVAVGATDAMGSANATMLPGGNVTAVLAYSRATPPMTYYRLVSWLDVEPGDTLEASWMISWLPGASFGSARFVLPEIVGATRYVIESRCAYGGSFSRVVNASLACSPADIYATAIDDSGARVGALAVDDFVVDSDATYDLSAEVWGRPKTTALTLDRLPLDVEAGPYPLRVYVEPGTVVAEAPLALAVAGTEKHASVSVTLPDVPRQDWQVTASFCRTGACQSLAARTAGSVDVTVDVGGMLLPWTSDAYVDGGNHLARWTETAGAPVDFAAADIDLGYVGVNEYAQWWIAGRPRDGTLAIPPLPSELARFDVSNVAASLRTVDLYAVPGAWNAVRAQWFRRFALQGVSLPLTAVGDHVMISGQRAYY